MYLPAKSWLQDYSRDTFVQDFIAAVIVTILLIPQSLAYAMLAGVPPEVGLYASILPLIAYALFGTSSTLSVGPVAVISLMTATTLGNVTQDLGVSYLEAATSLALISGGMLTLMGILKLGAISHFLSHSVISGFISASGILIALGQLKHILGVEVAGSTLDKVLPSLFEQLPHTSLWALTIGLLSIVWLVATKNWGASLLTKVGLKPSVAKPLARTAPILAVIASIAVVAALNLEQAGLKITGDVPQGLPSLSISFPSLALLQALALPAFMISLIGYIESVSVGRTLAAKRHEKVDANQELIGLGAANIASAVSGAYPVTGGFARSVVNFDAGAITQASSMMAAIGIAGAALFLTPLLYYLPSATLAATIIVAVVTLIDFKILKATWTYSKSDFAAVLATIIITLVAGVEIGVASGVILSITLHLVRTSKPHIAEIGLIEGTEHFRNVKRHQVVVLDHVMCLRIDESLFFANASYLETYILDKVAERPKLHHVLLHCSAINEIDFSALEMLEALNKQLHDLNVKLHLSEVKGPVHDRLSRSHFLESMSGSLFLTQFEAFSTLRLLNK